MPKDAAEKDLWQDMTAADDVRSQDDDAFLTRSKPDLEILDQLRLVKLKSYKFRKAVGIPLAAMLTPVLAYGDYWLLMLQHGDHDKGAGLSVAFLSALYWWVTQPRREYAAEYKKKLLPRIA